MILQHLSYKTGYKTLYVYYDDPNAPLENAAKSAMFEISFNCTEKKAKKRMEWVIAALNFADGKSALDLMDLKLNEK